MTLVGSAIAVILLAIAVLHAVWALGIAWPIRSEAELARTVVGAKGISRMPPRWASWLVVVALTGAAGLMLAASDILSLPLPDPAMHYAVWAMVAVFGLRGMLSYLPAWRRHLEPRFDRLNRWLYGPLCLVLAVGTWSQL